jgi:hypothetical protein
MWRVLTVLLFLVVLAEAAVIVIFTQGSQVSTIKIDQDRAAVQAQIGEAESESAKYSGGAVKALVEVRLAILRHTLAMLDQKRASWIRLVPLNYTIEGKTVREASDKELKDILDEITEAERTASSARQEAAQYTGGLIQAMALVKAVTEEITVASLRMKFYTAKYAMPIQVPSLGQKEPAPSPPGKVVKDREAL